MRRRGLLGLVGAALAAPALVRSGLVMPVRPLPLSGPVNRIVQGQPLGIVYGSICAGTITAEQITTGAILAWKIDPTWARRLDPMAAWEIAMRVDDPAEWARIVTAPKLDLSLGGRVA